jgi:short-subunit dehydrogenase
MTKIALITGASKGLGKEFSYIFARNGYALILVARSADELTNLQAELKAKYQCEAKIYPVDLSLPDSVDQLYNAFKDDFINLDVLVNNAGFGMVRKFTDMEAEDVRGMVELNVAALTKLSYKVLPHMVTRKSGKILNVASTAAFAPGPYIAEYFATKAYVLSLSEGLSEEFKSDGITISVLCPGPTRTEFFKRSGSTGFSSSASPAAASAAEVAEIGYQELLRGKRVIIPGLMNKSQAFLMWLLPHWLSLKLIASKIKPRHKA